MKSNINTTSKVNICYLANIFQDVAEILRYGCYQLGVDVCVNSGLIVSDRVNIIIGAHLVSELSQIPVGSIVVNFEQLGSDSVLISEKYMDLMRAHTVWDYSLRNIDWLAARGVKAELLRLGYSPYLRRINNLEFQDIDVLFYGAVNDRRAYILKSLQKRGLNVISISSGITGIELDAFISRSKIVLNLHYYETKIFEIVRVSYLLCNKKAVVAEVDYHTEVETEIKNAVLSVQYDEIIDACCDLAFNSEKRLELENRGWDIYSKRSQGKLMNATMTVVFKQENNKMLFNNQNNIEISSHPESGRLPLVEEILPLNINLGSGKNYLDGYLNIDINEYWLPDAILDLCDPDIFNKIHSSQRFGKFSLTNNHFNKIVANDVLEHVSNLPALMKNCLDILTVGGFFEISVPYDLSYGAWQDPTHVRAFNERSWLYYTDWFWYMGWTNARFELKSLNFILSDYGVRLQRSGMVHEDIVLHPRAIDSMKVILEKRLLLASEIKFVDNYLKR